MTRQKRTTEEPQEPSTALAPPDAPALVAAYSDAARMEAERKYLIAESAHRVRVFDAIYVALEGRGVQYAYDPIAACVNAVLTNEIPHVKVEM